MKAEDLLKMIKTKINIVLFEPEIPQNTGNIARLCACCGAHLFLVGKLGFSLSDKYVKRAGLDYWDSVNISKYDNLDDLIKENPEDVEPLGILYGNLLRLARLPTREFR